MERKAVLGIVLILLSTGMLTFTFNIRPAEAEPDTIMVPDDYSTIQEAVNSASPGDTVLVHSGTYYEHLTITKNNLTITGENADSTIIDGGGTPMVVVDVDTANDVKISGFTIRNGSEGVELYLSNGTIIRENTICSNTRSGITLDSSKSNTIADNVIILNDDIAIELYSSTGNSVSGNIMSNNSVGFGLFVGSTDNSIFGNTISHNGYVGVDVWQSGGNTIYHNNFIQNDPQVYPDRTNVWDNGAEGNYWSDYDGTDLYSGPSQGETGSDGIADKPYSINSINHDNYPLMGPINYFDAGPWNGRSYSVRIVSNSTVSKFQLSKVEKIMSFNVTGETGSGFCRISISNVIVSDLWQGEYTVLVDGEEPLSMSDWTDGAYTHIYFTYRHTERQVVIQGPDATPPAISILSPENKTHPTSSVPLTFTVNEPTSWIGYSLDDQANITIAENTTLSELSTGLHSLRVYANDTAGNIGSSETVYFTIQSSSTDTTPPSISIVSPENKTYTINDIPLTFTIDESVSWIAYSLDGNANMTITGNTTIIGVPDGSHSLIVYAKDAIGNLGGSETAYFSIETEKADPLPILIVAVVVILAGVLVVFGYVMKLKKK